MKLTLAAMVAMGSAACVEGFDSPSLYTSAPLQCGTNQAQFEERLRRCWDRGTAGCSVQAAGLGCGCFGVISLKGEVEGRSFRFDADLDLAIALVNQPSHLRDDAGVLADAASSTTEVVSWLRLAGAGPYFRFSLRLGTLPGFWQELPITTSQRFPIPYTDPRSGDQLGFIVDRLEAQGEATIPDLETATGWIELQLQSHTEYRVSFSARGVGTYWEGCLASKFQTLR